MNDCGRRCFLAPALEPARRGNIAMSKACRDSSRTFMGEEAASIDAARIALARIASGKADIACRRGAQRRAVGFAHFSMNSATSIVKDRFAPVWPRTEKQRPLRWGPQALFLVIESRAATPKGAVQSLMRG